MQGRDVAVRTRRQRFRVRGFARTRSPGVLGHVTQCPTSNSIVRVIIIGTRVIVCRVGDHESVWVQEQEQQHHNQGEWLSVSCQPAVAGKDLRKNIWIGAVIFHIS